MELLPIPEDSKKLNLERLDIRLDINLEKTNDSIELLRKIVNDSENLIIEEVAYGLTKITCTKFLTGNDIELISYIRVRQPGNKNKEGKLEVCSKCGQSIET